MESLNIIRLFLAQGILAMTDRLDAFVDALQEKIFNEAKGALGEEGFDRWRNPCYRGKLKVYDVHSRVTGECGDTMDIYLRVEKGVVVEASYVTDGCGTSNVCGSFAAELSIGKTMEALADITGEVILEKLGKLSEDEQHCAYLAAGTLHEGVKIYMTGDGDAKNRNYKV